MTVTIINADVMEGLRQLPDESVHCCVSSPPYWGLRDYGTGRWDGGDPNCGHVPMMGRGGGDRDTKHTNGAARAASPARGGNPNLCGKCGAEKVDQQIGLELTPEEHVARLVEVFREVRRVLRKDGTLWVNYGDCYATSVNGRSANDVKLKGNDDRTFRDKPFSTVVGGLKPKDLVGMPWRLAFALQADGWWLRSDIVWSKPNPMPESIRDRPTKAHEYVFLLAKSERYFYDAEAIKEQATFGEPNAPDKIKSPYGQGFTRNAGKNEASGDKRKDGFNERWKSKRSGRYVRGDASRDPASRQDVPEPGYVHNSPLRNRRTVWTIATQPFSEAHFATMPPALAELCIKAGCPAGGTVLDPFGGAGTTGLVADRLQREAILIELNPAYAAMARARIEGDRGALLDIMEPAEPPLFREPAA